MTPIALVVLRGYSRGWLLATVWAMAIAGSLLRITVDVPPWLITCLFLDVVGSWLRRIEEG